MAKKKSIKNGIVILIILFSIAGIVALSGLTISLTGNVIRNNYDYNYSADSNYKCVMGYFYTDSEIKIFTSTEDPEDKDYGYWTNEDGSQSQYKNIFLWMNEEEWGTFEDYKNVFNSDFNKEMNRAYCENPYYDVEGNIAGIPFAVNKNNFFISKWEKDEYPEYNVYKSDFQRLDYDYIGTKNKWCYFPTPRYDLNKLPNYCGECPEHPLCNE